MSNTQAFFLGVMAAYTLPMIVLALALCRTPRTDNDIQY